MGSRLLTYFQWSPWCRTDKNHASHKCNNVHRDVNWQHISLTLRRRHAAIKKALNALYSIGKKRQKANLPPIANTIPVFYGINILTLLYGTDNKDADIESLISFAKFKAMSSFSQITSLCLARSISLYKLYVHWVPTSLICE